MATSFEQKNFSLNNNAPYNERSISKIPTRNTSNVFCRENKGQNISDSLSKARNTASPTSFQTVKMTASSPKVGKKPFNTQRSPKTWKVQATEQTHYPYQAPNSKLNSVNLVRDISPTTCTYQTPRSRNNTAHLRNVDLEERLYNNNIYKMNSRDTENFSQNSSKPYITTTDQYVVQSSNPTTISASQSGQRKHQLFHLNSETVKEIDSIADQVIDYPVMICKIGNQKAGNTSNKTEVSNLLSTRTEELLRSNKKSRRSKRVTRNAG